MSDDFPEQNAPKQSQQPEPTGIQIAMTLLRIVEQIGDSPLADYWWEDFSHGLSMPVRGVPHRDRGFPARCKNSKRYIELESDFLHFDDEGYDRQDYGDPKDRPIELIRGDGIIHDNRVRSLALRVLAFSKTRAELTAQGFTLPENPELTKAIAAVHEVLAIDPELAAQFSELMDNETPSSQMKPEIEKTGKKLPHNR